MATRQELERNLPDASAFMRDYVWQLCAEARLNIQPQDFLLIMRMVHDYFKTERGIHTALKMLNIDVEQASPLKTYFKAGFMGDPTERIPEKDLWEVKGWVAKRGARAYTLKHNSVDVDEREDSTVCDCCGTRIPAEYCTKPVEVMKTNGGVRVETWCNHCRQCSEQPRIRETGALATCQACPKTICEFHPRHNEMVARSATKPSVVAGLLSPGPSGFPADMPIPPGWSR